VGTLAVALWIRQLMTYSYTPRTQRLSSSQLSDSRLWNYIGVFESAVNEFGLSSGTYFTDTVIANPPSAHAITMTYENLVLEYQSQAQQSQQEPLLIYYPGLNAVSNHPFAILDAPWVSDDQKTAAMQFRDFLLGADQQRQALTYGFRPSDPGIQLTGAPIDAAHGVDPRPVQAVLNVPSADVVQAVETSWKSLRRKVDVMLILDRSGSMNDNGKIGAARQGLLQFVTMLGDLDGLGLTVFNDSINVLSPVMPLGPNRQKIRDQINAITACCNTRLYDTIDQQVKALAALSHDRHIKVVVVLTDGQDDASTLTRDQLINDIAARGLNAGDGIKVFAIAYGSNADVTDLQAIAGATGGQEYAGTPQNIQQVYLQISSFF
jgi:Ca-activated chloride channel homolog